MNYIIQKKCNICGGFQRKILYTFSEQNLVKCLKCGLVYLDKQRSDLENLYNGDYYFNSENKNANYFNYYSRDQENLMKGNFGFAYKFIKENISVNRTYSLLDIGAGFGYFLNYLPRKVEASAVEVSRLAVKEIKKLGVLVYQKDFLKVPINKKYDYLTAFDVMEHQTDLKAFLEKCHKISKPGGYLLITIPDYGSVLNKLLGKKAPVIQPRYHNYYFGRRWLEVNLPKMGWEIISLRTTYFTKMTLDHLVLMASFAYPAILKMKLNHLLERKNWGKKIVTFYRMGGIEAIIKVKSTTVI